MIDLGVMNDFADDEKPALLENFARGIREIDRALDAVTKAKLFRESHRSVANFDNAAGAPDLVDNVATVVLLNLLLDGSHHVRCTQVHLLARRRSAGNEVRAHCFRELTTLRPVFSRIVAAEDCRRASVSDAIHGVSQNSAALRQSKSGHILNALAG